MPDSSRFILLLALAVLGLGAVGLGQGHSRLWGRDGAGWTAASRLPDFSFCGYRFGEEPIPDLPVVVDVSEFGAEGDGETDCTEAFRKAIAKAKMGAVFVPEGRYLITGVLEIAKSGIVLRGAGAEKTVLVIPKSLQQLEPVETYSGGSKLRYSFSGGFVHLRGRDRGKKIGKVIAPAKRGDRQLRLSSAVGIEPGGMIRLLMNNHEELGRYLHGGLSAGEATFKERRHFVDTVMRVTGVAGDIVTFDRPLRVDVQLDWKPEIRSFRPTVAEVGVEDLAFEFPGVPKRKHLLEEGFNAVFFEGVVHCWVRRVRVVDADNAVNIRGSRFCQVEDVRILAGKREGTTGHHALWATGNTQESLFRRFEIDTLYVHDLTVEGFAHGNVFKDGRGLAINLDHHRNGPYENLFSDIDLGNPRRLWASGGRGDRGPHSGVRETFWNLHWRNGKPPRVPEWPLINYVGISSSPAEKAPDGRWIESPEAPLVPPELHAAQLARRRSQEGK